MSDSTFPSREILELIRGQARMEEKIDAFMKAQNGIRTDLDIVKIDVADLKSKRAADKAYVAGAAFVLSTAAIFLIPWVKKFVGL